jgi:hypothetical protein
VAVSTNTFIDPSLQDRATVTITAVTTTATVAHTSHGYSNGDTVKIYGANESDYNGHFVISNVSANAYDYTMGGSPSSPATGTIKASKHTGTGTSGDQYSDVQWAYDSVTQDATNGDQFNVKAGTAEILAAAALSLTTYGTPTASAPHTLRGYTSSVNDGGIGEIDGNGFATYGSAVGDTHVIDMHCHSAGGASYVLVMSGSVGTSSLVENVEVDNNTGGGISGGRVFGSNIHNIGAIGISLALTAAHNYLKNGTNKFTTAISLDTSRGIYSNIVSIGDSSNGIFANDAEHIEGNSVLSDGGIGKGIDTRVTKTGNIINSNLVEGFSGAGGVGIEYHGTSAPVMMTGHNAARNNTTDYANLTDVILDLGDNEVDADFTRSLFDGPEGGAGSDTFANRFTYFAPTSEGNVQGGAYPSGCRLDKGAAQHADPAGGGGLLVHPGTSGGARG